VQNTQKRNKKQNESPTAMPSGYVFEEILGVRIYAFFDFNLKQLSP
jgi:hypothetical protein